MWYNVIRTAEVMTQISLKWSYECVKKGPESIGPCMLILTLKRASPSFEDEWSQGGDIVTTQKSIQQSKLP